MLVQNETLREHALGNFKAMVHAMARDPAMILWLDNAVSRKGEPNENWARELLELFTVGESSESAAYTEFDVQELEGGPTIRVGSTPGAYSRAPAS